MSVKDTEYYSKTINEFVKKYEQFKITANKYEESLNIFNESLKGLIENQENISQTSNIEKVYENKSDNSFYLLTKEKILMKITNDPNELLYSSSTSYDTINFDFTSYENTIIPKDTIELNDDSETFIDVDIFFSSKPTTYYGDSASNLYEKTNKILQIGLSDLSFNNEDNYIFKSIPSSLQHTIKKDGDCDTDLAYRCDNYAKMNGKLNYGLMQNNTNSQCECYIFDNLNDTSDPIYKLETLDMNNDITDILNGEITLKYIEDGVNVTEIYLDISLDGINTPRTLIDNDISLDVLDVFSFPDESNVIKQLTLDNSGVVNTMEHIEESLISEYEIKDNYALYDNDMYFRLIINKETLQLFIQYSKKSYENDTNTTAKWGMYNDEEETRKNIYINQLEDNNINSFGEMFNKVGYVGYDNTLLVSKDGELIKTNTNPEYEEYQGYALNNIDTLIPYSGSDINYDCGIDSSCVGYIIDDNNDNYIVSNDNVKNIYKNASNDYEFFLKKLGTNVNGNYKYDSTNTTMITLDEYNNYIKSNENNLTHVENIINKHNKEINEYQSLFIAEYSELLNLFNNLSKEELILLKETGIKTSELSNTIKRYQDLYKKGVGNQEYNKTLSVELSDYDKLQKRTKIQMGILGIASVLSLIGLFKIMKK